MVEKNVLAEKTLAFAIRIVNGYKYLIDNKKESVMSKQMLMCGYPYYCKNNQNNKKE